MHRGTGSPLRLITSATFTSALLASLPPATRR